MPRNFCRLRLLGLNLLIALLACCSSYAARTSRTSESSGSLTTVVIDAGHEGHDRGGIPGQRIAEKDMTLDVAQRLRNVQAASRYHVVMSGDSDSLVSLPTVLAF